MKGHPKTGPPLATAQAAARLRPQLLASHLRQQRQSLRPAEPAARVAERGVAEVRVPGGYAAEAGGAQPGGGLGDEGEPGEEAGGLVGKLRAKNRRKPFWGEQKIVFDAHPS